MASCCLPISVGLSLSFTRACPNVLGRYVHVCVVECEDASTYKQRGRDEIAAWLQDVTLLPHGQWLIVQYTAQPLKAKGMKITLRDSVISRIRSDFGGKNANERCLQLKRVVAGSGGDHGNEAPAGDDRPDLWEVLAGKLERAVLLSLEDRLALCLQGERTVVANPMFHGKACSDTAFRQYVAVPMSSCSAV